MTTPPDQSDESSMADKPMKRKGNRPSLEVAREVLESLKYELSHGGGVDEETVSDMEDRLKELEGKKK